MPDANSKPAAQWSAETLAGNPHTRDDKPARVRGMFAAIAKSYDLNNRLHSLWQDQRWRKHAVRAAALKPTDTVLDVACGTGDLTIAFAREGAQRVLGVDFTREMLDIAEHKRTINARSLPPEIAGRIEFRQGDATKLDIPDASFDVVSIAFGIRNVSDPAAAAREFFRVLKPGGRVVILEFDKPSFAPARWFSSFYTDRIMPMTATLISRDKSGAYKYLPRSVSTFMNRVQLAQMLRETGFGDVRQVPLSFGVCVCTSATKS